MAFKMKGYGYPGKSPIKDMKTGSYKHSFEKKSSDSPLYRKSPLEQNEVEEEYNPLNWSDWEIEQFRREQANANRNAKVALNQLRKQNEEADQEVGMSFTDETIIEDKARLEELNEIRNKRAWTREEINEASRLHETLEQQNIKKIMVEV